ncbi:hypothetical protein DUNSADRAFT_6346 [Dunaliella salina]|uniref:Uncharacterized protein n=1 Tax=Dunaliella salina TaxID=3046 RepID=A0ABQ7GNJ2_DUNSA|nr:hypothetical protein DUNSADRAFT_6346 [Dunaliella salina]|eukprot:KAF5836143.1 hypothetical protein DUNSADRAFT_6346 [Dunaliella salina]
MGLSLLGGPQENLNLLSSPTKPPPPSRLLLGQQQEGMRGPGSPSKAPPLRPLANPININACVYQNGETPASSTGNSSSASSSPTKQLSLHPHLRAPSVQGLQHPDLPDSASSENGNITAAGFVKASSPPGAPPSHHRLASASRVDAASTPASTTSPHTSPPLPKPSGSSPSKARTHEPSAPPPALGAALQQQQQQQHQVGQGAKEGGGAAGNAALRPPVGHHVGGPGGEGLPEGSNPSGSSATTPAPTGFVPRPPPSDSSPGAPRPPSADIVAHVNVVNAVSDASKAGIVYGGNLVPRPPSVEAGPDHKGLPHVRTRRRSSRLNSPVEGNRMQDNSPMCGASPQAGKHLQGELQRTPSTLANQDAASLISRAQSLTSMGSNQTELSSPAPTPGSAHRPNSGRTRAVQFLVDAVRSKDSARFQDALDYLRLPNGAVAGLNEHHSVTGRTPLHEAVMLNNMSTVQRLLEAGAQPNKGHMLQGPPLLHAAAWGEADMVELLLEAGADVRVHDIAGHTALHYACSGGHALAAQALLRRGADINAKNEDGDTPMVLAEHHPTLQSLLRSWSPARGTSASSTTASSSRSNTPIAGSMAGGAAAAARAGGGGPLPTPGSSSAPSPPQQPRQTSGRAGELRVGATPVPRGHKMQVQAQQVYVQGGQEQGVQGGGAGQQQQPQQDPHLQHQSHHHSNQNQSLQVQGPNTPHHHVHHSHHPIPSQQQQQQQQPPQQQQPMVPQPPGYSSMSTRKHSKRPNLGRSLSLASADSPASAARVAGVQAPESGSDAPSGSEGG